MRLFRAFFLIVAAWSCQSAPVAPPNASAVSSASSVGGGAATTAAGSASGQAMASSGASGGAKGSQGGAGGAPSGARDWAQFPAVVDVDGAPELWALSDVHGDYNALTALLAGAGLIAAPPATPQQVQWNAGKACLVVVGDLIDKGPDAPDAVSLLVSLAASAKASGGRVIATMGNHEAEFLADPENAKAMKADGFDPELQAIGDSPADTAAGKDDLGAFIRGMPFAARVDDWFFVHAGNTGGQTLAQLSSALQSGVDANGFGAPVLADPNSLLEARLNGAGPQWWDAGGDAQKLLGQWTAALGVKHLVMGHQPKAVAFGDGSTRAQDQMFQDYAGLIFLIDTGMSVDVDATGGALLHVTGPGTANESWQQVLPDGTAQSF